MASLQPSSEAEQAAQTAAILHRQQGQDIPRRKPVPATATFEKPVGLQHNTSNKPVLQLWHRYSRRTHVIAIAVVLAILILIIGLAAGLSTRSKSQDYDPGLGACGVTSANGDRIVAVSHLIFDAVQVGSNPNTNPLCGKKVRVKRLGGDVTVDLTVVDRCTGCKAQDLDMTEDTFSTLADVALGRVTGVWSWLDSVPGGATGS